MHKLMTAALALLMLLMTPMQAHAYGEEDVAKDDADDRPWSFAIHGGAGTIKRENLTPEKDAEIRAALQKALDAGSSILKNGGSAMDAIKAAIVILEDDPNFNAGKGAVLTWDGTHELDASIMDGRDRSAGAVAGASATKNPILLADAVKDKSRHVLLSGKGADQFSREQGMAQVAQDYYTTPARKASWQRMRERAEKDKAALSAAPYKYGTVGAVAMDKDGNMAAGTSTGGMTGKRWGRIGDSPIIGAGTYADNRSCAVSATGWGEFFIRSGVAQEICTRLRIAFPEAIKEAQKTVPKDTDGNYTYYIHASEFPFPKEAAQDIADEVIADMDSLGGDGGIILATPWGHALYSFDTPGMYRGRATSEGINSVAIYGDEQGTEAE